jgi:hypothetical protein
MVSRAKRAGGTTEVETDFLCMRQARNIPARSNIHIEVQVITLALERR